MAKVKHHSKQFVLAPSNGTSGTMICHICKKDVIPEKHDYRLSMKVVGDNWDDWGYCTIHRECLQGEEHRFIEIENQIKKWENRLKDMESKVKALEKSDSLAFSFIIGRLVKEDE